MEPRELERRLKRKELAPVVLLWGEETLLVEEAVRQIEAVALDPEGRAFDREVYYGDDAEAQTIVTAAQTLPWLGAQRLVLVRGAEALSRAADAPLVAYCKQPSPSTCLIFTAHAVEPSRALFALLLKLPWAVRFRRLPAREVAMWIERRIAARGCRITAETVAALVEAVGNDLRLLANEIDKLVTFVGPGQAVEIGSLMALTGDVRETSAFELARLLSAGDLVGALRSWGKFASSGEYPGLALGAITHHVRQLWRIKLGQHAGVSPERLASELNIPAFTVRRLSAQAATFESERLRQWLELLLEADQTLKRSGLSPQAVFERLILRFCVGAGGVYRPA
ncbi:MAG TPA: DNA polymerase III subunit delta [Candidatus Tectomicrobia bacterium]|nr:DNA polymerase III subunit delta [Candidatus Tectomicrobia bacterium]